MAAGAGFLLEPTSYAPPRNGASLGEATSSSSAAPIEPRRLTASQLTRLRSHLDDALLSIQRRFARRYHDAGSSSSSSSSSSTTPPPLGTLTAYTQAWTNSILPLVSRIDPYGSAQTATLTAYAMTIADAAPNGITGYDLPLEGRGEALLGALELLGLIDALWAALLVGRSLSLPLATRRVRARLGVTDHPAGDDDDDDASRERLRTDRALRDSFPVSGSLGARTTSATDRVRLRNLLMDRKDAIRAWVGEQVGVRLPEGRDEEEEEEMRLSGRRRGRRRRRDGGVRRREGEGEGELDGIREVGDEVEDQPTANGDDEEGEGELEEVEVPAPHANGLDGDEEEGNGGGGNAEERGHYRDLFARKLNPDEDDGSESEGDEEGSGEEQEQPPQREVEDDGAGSRKRRRVDDDEGESQDDMATQPTAPTQAPPPPSDAAQDGHSTFDVPNDALAIERLTSQVFSRSLAALERLDAAAMAITT